jgi:chemotaxis protein methyltransferase CheR
MVAEKAAMGHPALRIWSAACARGEEPYSVAILIHALLEKEGRKMDLHLFATDIDKGVLRDAREALYTLSSVEDIKHRLLLKYFRPEGASFRLIPEIKAQVHFSCYDMLDEKRGVPPESVFGGFDLVLCRNLLIYFNPDDQVRIVEKLHHALADNGYLILGRVETLPLRLRHLFKQVFDFSPIYRKR